MEETRVSLLGFTLAALGLFACNREDTGVSGPKAAGTGSARIALPVVPSGYLAKSPAGSLAVFDLIISGDGMAPMQLDWTLASDTPASVVVAGIPVGMRVFQGRLIQFDSTGGDSLVTHEGIDSAFITRDSVAQVRLFLKRTGGGSAHVCVQVEGWPADSSCDTVVTPPLPDTVTDCFSVSQTLSNGKSAAGRLTLTTVGSYYHGAFHWNGFKPLSIWPDTLGGVSLDSAALNLMGVAPAGMLPSPNPVSDTVAYKIRLQPFATATGTLERLLPKGLSLVGTWKATRSACTSKDSLP